MSLLRWLLVVAVQVNKISVEWEAAGNSRLGGRGLCCCGHQGRWHARSVVGHPAHLCTLRARSIGARGQVTLGAGLS